MDRAQHDALYHLLRIVAYDSTEEEAEAIRALSVHLTFAPDYPRLLKYLQYYGERFLLPEVVSKIKENLPHLDDIKRVVDLGAGTGWYGKGIADGLDVPELLLADKRSWPNIQLLADLETEKGIQQLLDALMPGDLLVASELIHCLNNPELLISNIMKGNWPFIVLEYNTSIATLGESYRKQILKYGANPISPIQIAKIIESSMDHMYKWFMMFTLNPYVLFIIDCRRR